MKNYFPALGVAVFACLPRLAAAQSAAPNDVPEAAPQLLYRSAFADYRPYKDEPPGDWRKVNEAVTPAKRGVSGHAGHDMSGMKGMAPSPPATAAFGAAMKPQTNMPVRGGQHHHGGKP